MQIKTTLRFHFTPVRMAKIKNSGYSRCWQGYGERGTLLHCWWDCKLVQPLWKLVWQLLKRVDVVLPEDPAIPLMGTYLEDAPTGNKDTCSTMFTEALFIIARSWKEPRFPSKEKWIQKTWYIYTMEYYSARDYGAQQESLGGQQSDRQQHCEHPLMCLLGPGPVSQETAISGSFQPTLASVCNHPEWRNTIIKELKWYVFTDKSILAQKLSILEI